MIRLFWVAGIRFSGFAYPIQRCIYCIGGAVVKKGVLCVTALLTLGIASAGAEELPVAPSGFITKVPYLAWSGYYVGLNGGYAWGDAPDSYFPNDPAAALGTCGGGGTAPNKGQCIPSASFNRDGPLFGGQAGFNWQITSLWLTGVEADYQWADLKGTGLSPFRLGSIGFTNLAASQTVQSFGTLRFRVGAIPLPPLLLYATAGLALGEVNENLAIASPATAGLSAGGFSYFCTAGALNCFAGSSSKTLWGWSVGSGAEYAITGNVTFKTELLYVHLEAPSATATAQGVIGATAPASFTATFSPVYFMAVRGGVNYRF